MMETCYEVFVKTHTQLVNSAWDCADKKITPEHHGNFARKVIKDFHARFSKQDIEDAYNRWFATVPALKRKY